MAVVFLERTVLYAEQGEVVYKNVKMSQGVYFVIKGIAEAFKRTRKKEHMNGDAETEDKVKGIISVGNLFGYTRCAISSTTRSLSKRAEALKRWHIRVLTMKR